MAVEKMFETPDLAARATNAYNTASGSFGSMDKGSKTETTGPGKTAGGAAMNAGGGAVAGASLATSITASSTAAAGTTAAGSAAAGASTGSSAGWWGAGIGALIGLGAYFLS